MAEQTLYSSRMGGITPSVYSRLSQGGLPTQAPQQNKPFLMSGNTSLVRGQNLQPDIPQDQPQEQPLDMSQIPQVPSVTFDPNDFSHNEDQGDVGPKLPIKMPKDPTNGQKAYTPEHVQAGSQAISFGMKNNLPAPQTPVQAATQEQDHAKMQSDLTAIAGAPNPKKAWQEVQKDPFYKNSNFYTGMMNVGLAIMSGANPMQAFQAGDQAMKKGDMSSALGANRQALMDQGYSPASVEAAITSGDASKLQMQQMSDQDRMQAEDSRWAKRQQYADTRADAQTAQSNAEWDRRNAINQQNQLQQQEAADRRYQQRSQDMMDRQKQMIDYRQKVKQDAAAQQANSYDFDARSLNAEGKAGGYDSNKQWIEKAQTFDVANKDLQQAQNAIKAGDSQAARGAYTQALMNAVRGEIGVNRSMQPEDLEHFGADPSLFVKKGNEWSMKAGAAPTQASLKYLQDQVNTGLTSANQSIQDFKTQRIKSLVASGMDKRRATALVNRRAGGVFHDPMGAFESNVDASQGALSTGGDDYSWMNQ